MEPIAYDPRVCHTHTEREETCTPQAPTTLAHPNPEQDGFVAEGEESGTKFKNIDLSDDWCEFDERQNESVRKRGKTDGRWQWCSTRLTLLTVTNRWASTTWSTASPAPSRALPPRCSRDPTIKLIIKYKLKI
jgi:hypothetical protein